MNVTLPVVFTLRLVKVLLAIVDVSPVAVPDVLLIYVWELVPETE